MVSSFRPVQNALPKIFINTGDLLDKKVVRNRSGRALLCLDFEIRFHNQSEAIREERITENYGLEIEPSIESASSSSVGE